MIYSLRFLGERFLYNIRNSYLPYCEKYASSFALISLLAKTKNYITIAQSALNFKYFSIAPRIHKVPSRLKGVCVRSTR